MLISGFRKEQVHASIAHTSERTERKYTEKEGREQQEHSVSIPSHPPLSARGSPSSSTRTSQNQSSDSVTLTPAHLWYQCPSPLLSELLPPQSAVLMWTVDSQVEVVDRNYSVLFKTVSKHNIKNLLLAWGSFDLGTPVSQLHIFQKWLGCQPAN